METGTLTDIAVCIVAAWIFGVVAQVLRQPVLLAYLLAGYVIGPNTSGIISGASVDSISGIGLLLLLFVIGLEIDLKTVLSSGRVILIAAGVQIVGTVLLGLACFHGIGLPASLGKYAGLYFSVACLASSTVIAVKLLADKRELDTLPGRLTIGISVLQDVAVISFLGMQPVLDSPSAAVIALIGVKIVALVGIALGISKYVLPPLFRRVATLPELVVVGALAWCFVVAAVAHGLHLSREMGALVAGIAISTFPYHLDVTAKLSSLRDFFITLFFVGLGLRVPAPEAAPLQMALLLSAFVLVSRVLTVVTPLRLLGMGNRASMLTCLNLLPLSEFALVLLALGKEVGHVSDAALGPVVYAFFLLAIIGSYGITGSDRIFRAVEPWLVRAGLRDAEGQEGTRSADDGKPDIFILGFYWTASSLLEEIGRNRPSLLPRLAVIDFNPQVHQRLKSRGVRAIWGDISQRDTLAHAGVAEAAVVICSLPNSILRGANNLRLVQGVRSLNPTALIIAPAEQLADVPRLKSAGANYVLLPRLHEADDLLSALDAADNRLLEGKQKHLEERLAERREIVP